MKYSFLKVASMGIYTTIANVPANIVEIIKKFKIAVDDGAKLVVFPELSLTGYSCQDLFLGRGLEQDVLQGIQQICEKTLKTDALLVVGAPLKYRGFLYNCAVVIKNGKVLAVVPKVELNDLEGRNESRYFASGHNECGYMNIGSERAPFGSNIILQHSTLCGLSIACELGDISTPFNIGLQHSVFGASVICNLAASAEYVGSGSDYNQMLYVHSEKMRVAYLHSSAGAGESSGEIVYAGRKCIVEVGELLSTAGYNEDGVYADIDIEKLEQQRMTLKDYKKYLPRDTNYHYIEFDMDFPSECSRLDRYKNKQPFLPCAETALTDVERIFSLQQRVLLKRMRASRAKNIVLGLSGGLDSTLALLVAHAVGKQHGFGVHAFSMPCFGTGSRTKNNAQKLAQLLQVEFAEVDISSLATQELSLMKHVVVGDVVYENLQARHRTAFLLNMANKVDAIVLGTGDLSESALGFCTYGGDHFSMYNINGSIPKTLAREIVKMYADACGGELGVVLHDIVDTPISPELLPTVDNGELAQSTENIVGNYNLIDYLLYYHLKYQFSKEKLEFLLKNTFVEDYTEAEITKALNSYYARFYRNQFKRNCSPEGAKVTEISLSPRAGWFMPSDL